MDAAIPHWCRPSISKLKLTLRRSRRLHFLSLPPHVSAGRHLCCRILLLEPEFAMADDERRAKRSRFDQTEPDRRQSRFDRRSRSPTSRQPESTRHRSPLGREARSPGAEAPKSASPHDPAAAAGEHSAATFFQPPGLR